MWRSMAAVVSVMLVVGLAATLAGCGTDVTGTYLAASDDPEFETAELVVNDDNTFELSAEIVGTEETVTFTGSWSLDGDVVTLEAEGLNETETGTVVENEGTRLVFDEVTWVKQ